MKRFNNINEFNCKKSTIITIGTFDGVHLGHQKILKKLNVEAENNGLESSVLTFFPHPRTVLNPDSSLKLINTIEERISLFKKSRAVAALRCRRCREQSACRPICWGRRRVV